MNTYIAKGEGAERFEHVPIQIYDEPKEAVKAVAKEIAELIRSKQAAGKHTVLGLATGQSPVMLYKELIRLHKEEGLSFKDVYTFNLDEYSGLEEDDKNSYHYFMNFNLFDHIDIDKSKTHVPNGLLKDIKEIREFCANYEKQIEELGGLDFQVLGIGRTGHIGFNEPGSQMTSITRKVYLNDITINDATKDFGARERVPRSAVTMGVSTIMKARRIVLLAWGDKKAPIVKRTVEGPITDQVPATFLQAHNNVTFFVDTHAACELTRATKPWLCGKVEWTNRMVRKAVISLCQETGKPILKLINEDYTKHGLFDLLSTFGSSYEINIKVFNDIQHTITGWPGGKPNADDSTRPEKASPFPKTCLIFSPHPDDDVISMGGTFSRLVSQGNHVHVAYHTTGSIAVNDDYLYQMMDTTLKLTRAVSGDDKKVDAALTRVKDFIKTRGKDSVEPEDICEFKARVREAEALSACRYIGVDEKNVHFLRLPFYNTGSVRKNELGKADIDIVVNVLREVKPNQIYAAGDLADPHGTHAVCFWSLIRAFDVVKNDDWFKNCSVWFYRGAWMEWPVEEVDMAVPISPAELMQKRLSIFRHGSQNNNPAFPGDDAREFWQRAEDRNRNTARIYNELGMPEYEAIEVFARYYHQSK